VALARWEQGSNPNMGTGRGVVVGEDRVDRLGGRGVMMQLGGVVVAWNCWGESSRMR